MGIVMGYLSVELAILVNISNNCPFIEDFCK